MIAQRQAGMSVAAACEALAVSESGYYYWQQYPISQREQKDKQLGKLITRIFYEKRQTYGSFRIMKELRRQGIGVAHKRVARIMRELGLRSIRASRKYGKPHTTTPGHHQYIADNHLQQDFTTDYANQKWVTDTTYIATQEGWLYLVAVLDLFDRQVVGWAMGDQHNAQLATRALTMAIARRHPSSGLIVHSDRGSEFANQTFHHCAHRAGIQLSMSATGNCYDNAPAESFFATIKLEAVCGQVYVSKQFAQQALFDYIEVFYNRQRLHSGIDYNVPVSFVA